MFFETKLIKGELEKEFNDIFGEGFLKEARNLHQTKDAFVKNEDEVTKIVVEMPGVKKENIDISFHKNILTIMAIKSKDVEVKRTFEVKADLYDVKNIFSKYEDGVLTLTIPKLKASEEKNKPIKIQLQ